MFVAQATLAEVVLHRETCTEQADPVYLLRSDSHRSGICDVEQRDLDVLSDFICRLVHRVGAEDDEISAAVFDMPSGFDDLLGSLGPLAFVLEWFDFRKVHRIHDALGRVEPAQPFLDALINEPVVDERGLPTHAADEPNRLHDEPLEAGGQCKWLDTASRRTYYNRRGDPSATPNVLISRYWVEQRLRVKSNSSTTLWTR